MARKSPQEKKRLSLLKDRRNTYGENSKGSRKAIPRHKKGQRRAARRIEKQILSAGSPPESELGDAVKVRLASHQTWVWKKTPDTPLGEAIDWKLNDRAKRGEIPPELAQSRRAAIQRRTKK